MRAVARGVNDRALAGRAADDTLFGAVAD